MSVWVQSGRFAAPFTTSGLSPTWTLRRQPLRKKLSQADLGSTRMGFRFEPPEENVPTKEAPTCVTTTRKQLRLQTFDTDGGIGLSNCSLKAP